MLSRILRWFRRPSPAPITFLAPRKLTAEERLRIRDWLNHPDTQLALSAMAALHPGTNMPAFRPRDEWETLAVVNRTHFIRGWEWFYRQLVELPLTPVEFTHIQESYPVSE